MTFLLAALVALTIVMILTGTLAPRRAIIETRQQYNDLERINKEVQGAYWDGVWTQAEVLGRLPHWMRSDFDCPSGAHEWLHIVPPISFNAYAFCKHCPTKRRGSSWPDTQRDPAEVVLSLQHSR